MVVPDRERYENRMQQSDAGASRARGGGICVGDRWRDPRGDEFVITQVRNLGVVAYRKAADKQSDESMLDLIRFIQRFRPSHVE